MHVMQWATCAQLASTLIVMTISGGPAAAQKAGNSAKLQKRLEAMAARLEHKDLGPVKARSAAVGDHMLTLEFAPAEAVDGNLTLKTMKELSWERAICMNKDALEFISSEGVTVRIVLARAGQSTDSIADVTAASCAREATIDPTLSRLIGGAAFAPRPTKKQALAMVQAYVAANFFDPDAAQIKCADPGPPAWVKPTLERRRHGYFLNCSINGKNRLGGYVGFTPYLFRMNGDEFESMDVDDGKSGLMEPTK